MISILVFILLQLSGQLTGCKPEWVLNKKLERCYRLPVLGQDELMTWDEASQYCNKIQSELLCLTDYEEQKFLFNTMVEHSLYEADRVWLGISCHEDTCTCVNTSIAVNVSDYSWVRDLPFSSSFGCLQLLRNGRVVNEYCYKKEYFVCSEPDNGRREITSETLNIPTTPQPQIKSPQTDETCTQTRTVLSVMMAIFVLLSLLFSILYIRQRKQAKKPNTNIYDRAIVQSTPEHIYQSFDTSHKTASPGQIYDYPTNSVHCARQLTGANGFIEKGLEDSAYLAVRIDNI